LDTKKQKTSKKVIPVLNDRGAHISLPIHLACLSLSLALSMRSRQPEQVAD